MSWHWKCKTTLNIYALKFIATADIIHYKLKDSSCKTPHPALLPYVIQCTGTSKPDINSPPLSADKLLHPGKRCWPICLVIIYGRAHTDELLAYFIWQAPHEGSDLHSKNFIEVSSTLAWLFELVCRQSFAANHSILQQQRPALHSISCHSTASLVNAFGYKLSEHTMS